MREREHAPRTRVSAAGDESGDYERSNSALLGRNDKSVRFMFAPPAMVDDV